MAAAICGVDGSGDPTVCGTNAVATDKYTQLSGNTGYLGYVVPVCSVVDGVPQVCDVTGGSSSDTTSALTLETDGIAAQGTWPTTDPLVSGRAWQDHGVMMLSTGSTAQPRFSGSLLSVNINGVTDVLADWISAGQKNTQTAQTTANSAATAASAAQTTANAAIPLTQKGAASGVAALDSNGDVTASVSTTGTVSASTVTATKTATAPTPATTDNSTNVATTAYVNNAFQSVEYSVQGDISTAGSSIQIPFGTSGLYAKFAYTGSGSASMTFYSTSGTLSPVDIRRNSIWGGSGVETFTLDNGSVTTSGVVADGTVYTQSNDSSAYFIRVGGQVYFLTVWASNNGARAFMGVHKMI